MRILEQSENRLILEEKPWFWGLFLVLFILAFAAGGIKSVLDGDYTLTAIAMLVVAAVGALAAFSIERVWLILDRASGTAELRRRSLRRFRLDVFPLSELAPDRIMIQSDEGMLRIALQLASRPEPLQMTSYYQSSGNIRPCAEAARKWLAACPVRV